MANYGNVNVFGDPTAPGWVEQNIVPVTVNGQTWQVNRAAAPAFEGFLQALAKTGYGLSSSGGYNYRTIRGSNRLSQHAFGNAIDINAGANPMLQGRLQTDLPANVGELAAQFGLEWGGNWKNRPDPMHFEWVGDGQQPIYPPGAPQPPQPPGPPTPPAPPGLTDFAALFGNDQPAGASVRQQAEDRAAAERARRVALLSMG